jgi:hypothetical protein
MALLVVAGTLLVVSGPTGPVARGRDSYSARPAGNSRFATYLIMHWNGESSRCGSRPATCQGQRALDWPGRR